LSPPLTASSSSSRNTRAVRSFSILPVSVLLIIVSLGSVSINRHLGKVKGDAAAREVQLVVPQLTGALGVLALAHCIELLSQHQLALLDLAHGRSFGFGGFRNKG